VITERMIKMVGRRKSTKASKRDTLAANKKRGKIAEEYFEIRSAIHGKSVERTPKGKDFTVREKDIFGRTRKTTHVEVKSSDTAPLSKRQKEIQRTHTNYKVVRIKPVMH